MMCFTAVTGRVTCIIILAWDHKICKRSEGSGLRKFTVGINGLEFTLDAQIKYLA